uniref:DUF1843 domain-containing protein n=1 Tax=Caenorhabditis tropicalis TaxID=1561998 RepID=A0A1I7T6N3_9PELO
MSYLDFLPALYSKMPQNKEELLTAGLSSQAADGILKIGREFEEEAEKKGTAKNPLAAIGATIQLLKDLDTFIKTQSKADQDAYAVLLEKKKALMEADAKKNELFDMN